jgi:hypothetical protein
MFGAMGIGSCHDCYRHGHANCWGEALIFLAAGYCCGWCMWFFFERAYRDR